MRVGGQNPDSRPLSTKNKPSPRLPARLNRSNDSVEIS